MTFLTATMLRDAAISFPMLGDWSIDPPYSFTVFGFEIYFYGAINRPRLYPRRTVLCKAGGEVRPYLG